MTETTTASILQAIPLPLTELIIAIKGAGEMATGIATRLFQANFKQIFMVEIENPVAVRRRSEERRVGKECRL